MTFREWLYDVAKNSKPSKSISDVIDMLMEYGDSPRSNEWGAYRRFFEGGACAKSFHKAWECYLLERQGVKETPWRKGYKYDGNIEGLK